MKGWVGGREEREREIEIEARINEKKDGERALEGDAVYIPTTSAGHLTTPPVVE